MVSKNTRLIINTEILNSTLFDRLGDEEKLSFLNHPSTVVFGVYEDNNLDAAGVLHFNNDHIYVRYLVGKFNKHINVIDQFVVTIGRTLDLQYVAMEYQRNAVLRIGQNIGYHVNRDNELVKGL